MHLLDTSCCPEYRYQADSGVSVFCGLAVWNSLPPALHNNSLSKNTFERSWKRRAVIDIIWRCCDVFQWFWHHDTNVKTCLPTTNTDLPPKCTKMCTKLHKSEFKIAKTKTDVLRRHSPVKRPCSLPEEESMMGRTYKTGFKAAVVQQLKSCQQTMITCRWIHYSGGLRQ